MDTDLAITIVFFITWLFQWVFYMLNYKTCILKNTLFLKKTVVFLISHLINNCELVHLGATSKAQNGGLNLEIIPFGLD